MLLLWGNKIAFKIHLVIAEAFAEGNPYFLRPVSTNYCQGKIVVTTLMLIFRSTIANFVDNYTPEDST